MPSPAAPLACPHRTLGMNPAVLESMVTEAGFSRFAMHDLDDPTNLYYEVRP